MRFVIIVPRDTSAERQLSLQTRLERTSSHAAEVEQGRRHSNPEIDVVATASTRATYLYSYYEDPPPDLGMVASMVKAVGTQYHEFFDGLFEITIAPKNLSFHSSPSVIKTRQAA